MIDYGDVKIVNFARPGRSAYAMRFLFDERRFALHITGDLGVVTAINQSNMTLKDCGAFCADPGYFAEKVVCMDRPRWVYDADAARAALKELFADYDVAGNRAAMAEFWREFEWGFSQRDGLSEKVADLAREIIGEGFDGDLSEIGQRESGIFEVYMGALGMARDQVFLSEDGTKGGGSV